jgi:hypothetical protein
MLLQHPRVPRAVGGGLLPQPTTWQTADDPPSSASLPASTRPQRLLNTYFLGGTCPRIERYSFLPTSVFWILPVCSIRLSRFFDRWRKQDSIVQPIVLQLRALVRLRWSHSCSLAAPMIGTPVAPPAAASKSHALEPEAPGHLRRSSVYHRLPEPLSAFRCPTASPSMLLLSRHNTSCQSLHHCSASLGALPSDPAPSSL